MQDKQRVLVTGAGGFIGGWVVELFHLCGRSHVRAGLRKWSSGARVGRFPVEIVLCDVLNEGQVDSAVKGVDAIVHCAYGSAETTVQGTRNMLEASLKHGIRRFVHLSTIDIYGTREGEVDETSPAEHAGSDYGDSKIEAEKLCWQYYERGLPVSILRPSIVYGPYCKLWVVKFAERIKSGNWGVFDGIGDGVCNLVYVKDLVDAIALGLDSPRAPGEAFNVNGSETISWNDYFNALNDALGLPQLKPVGSQKSRLRSLVSMPVRVAARYVQNHYGDLVTTLYRQSALAKRIMKRTEQSLKTTPSTVELAQFSRKSHYSIKKANLLLGYDPKTDIQTGLRISADWLRHETAS